MNLLLTLIKTLSKLLLIQETQIMLDVILSKSEKKILLNHHHLHHNHHKKYRMSNNKSKTIRILIQINIHPPLKKEVLVMKTLIQNNSSKTT